MMDNQDSTQNQSAEYDEDAVLEIAIDGPDVIETQEEDAMNVDIDAKVPALVSEITPGSLESRPEAVYLNGVDEMSSADVKSYARIHFPDADAILEWVDDSSVLCIYDNPEIANKALLAFTNVNALYEGELDMSALRSAKEFPDHDKIVLKTRIAFQTDKKVKGARERSRYYLFHGDPREDEERDRRRDRDRRTNKRNSSPIRREHKDQRSDGRLKDNDDGFPSVLNDKNPLRPKTDVSDSLSRRIGPSARRRSQSPVRREREWDRGKERDWNRDDRDDRDNRDRDHGRNYRRQDRELYAIRGSAGRDSLASRVGLENEKVVTSLADRVSYKGKSDGSSFASRLSVKDDDRTVKESREGRRRKRAHHLDFD
ncbi:hypothetical protein V1511DRAFT_495830 [Dipodascopsis uninucleata]